MVVTVRGLTVDAGHRRLLDGVDLHIGQGERVGLVGASGSGKSLIAQTILGLLPRHMRAGGVVRLGDTSVLDSDERTLARMRGSFAGMVFQQPLLSLNPVMTVAQQVALPLRLHYDVSERECRDRVMDMLQKVGLDSSLAGRYPHTLSGGQAQRVGIATALITSPQLIVADEPTTALDALTQRHIVDVMVRLVDEAGASMLFITHDFAVLSRATTRCLVLDAGRVVDEGATMAMLHEPGNDVTRALVRSARMVTLRQEDYDV